MSDRDLIETQSASKEMLRGAFFHAVRDTVIFPSINAAIREYFVHPCAVMVVPILQAADSQRKLVLQLPFRYPVGQVMVEFPASKKGGACSLDWQTTP